MIPPPLPESSSDHKRRKNRRHTRSTKASLSLPVKASCFHEASPSPDVYGFLRRTYALQGSLGTLETDVQGALSCSRTIAFADESISLIDQPQPKEHSTILGQVCLRSVMPRLISYIVFFFSFVTLRSFFHTRANRVSPGLNRDLLFKMNSQARGGNQTRKLLN